MKRAFAVIAVGLLLLVPEHATRLSAQRPAAQSPATPRPGAVKTEIGEINGASFRIDLPEEWNGRLVLMNHGYSAERTVFRAGANPRGLAALLLAEGYAIAQSGYSAGGWAIEEAMTDNENLRRYFAAKHGKPKETYAAGGAMGAYTTMALLEKFPGTYDGGLSYSGPLASFRIKSFDLRILFDYYFPGALPPLEETPKDYSYGGDSNRKLQEILNTKPEKAEILRRYAGLKTVADLARRLSFNTYTLRELQLRAGGNPFDNRGTIYNVDDDLAAVNAGVKRYTADPKALTYARAWASPTGKFENKLLAVHPVYDPISDVDRALPYQQSVMEAGCEDKFVQQYVNSEGHGNISPQVLLQSFHQLRDWSRGGPSPPWGLVKE